MVRGSASASFSPLTTRRLLAADLCPVLRFLLFLIFFLTLAGGRARAQVVTAGPDSAKVSTAAVTGAELATVDTAALSRPAKAALWGLIPGGGQVYNHDYWKVPIVYAALGGMMYSMVFANTRYVAFARAYRYRTDKDSTTTDTGSRTAGYKLDAIGNSQVKNGRDFFRRNRDLSIIGMAATYGLSIAEALVDAHLATFSVSDDLSLRLAPTVVPVAGAWPAPGISLTFSTR